MVKVVNIGDNGRVRILDVVFSEHSWSRNTQLSCKATIATAYYYNMSRDVRKIYFDSYQDREFEFTGKHPLKDDDIGSLEMSAQVSSDYETSRLYGEGVDYKDVYSINLRKVERMAKVLRFIEKGLVAKQSADGYHASFGQYLARVGALLGCVGVRVTIPDSLREEWMSTNEKIFNTTGDAVDEITGIAEKWWKKQQKLREEVAS